MAKTSDAIQRYINSFDMNSDFLFAESTYLSLVDEISTYLEITYGTEEKEKFLNLAVENDTERRISSGRMRAYLFSLNNREPSQMVKAVKLNKTSISSKSVFIVHGHDNEAKETVARFIANLSLKPIILHEQPNNGKTIIDKFETNADEIAFAVVLLTPDDIGKSVSSTEYKNRARQNVIYELGFFNAKITRSHVCVLKKGDVEVLSDYLGVVYIEMDKSGAWKSQLAKEIKAAGLPVTSRNIENALLS